MGLDLNSLLTLYKSGAKPSQILIEIYDKISLKPLNPVWISLHDREIIAQRAAALDILDPDSLALYGVPFAVKDNIDVAGIQTTAGCPAFAYTPDQSATVVTKLEQAGAVVIGKTNLDQFATGLVGTRSPYGACSSVFNDRYISGGSSSGSAVAVASGQVAFAIGTDTAGSGRVPAAFNNLIGLKPTPGYLSAHGVIPACRTLDCVSIFALTASDALEIYNASRGFDPSDAYSSPCAGIDSPSPWTLSECRIGVPCRDQMLFFGDTEGQNLFEKGRDHLSKLGSVGEFDLQPFLAVANLLYSGPWVAERLAVLKDFIDHNPNDIHPTVRKIVGGAARFTAVDYFQAQYHLVELRRTIDSIFENFDLLCLPTTGTTYTIADVEANPIELNSNLGFYMNFVNLLGLAAVAVPAGFRPNGLPFGVTLISKPGTEYGLLYIADQFHRLIGGNIGGTSQELNSTPTLLKLRTPPGCVLVAVVGAHLSGQPLNHQLVTRGAKLVTVTTTAANYRLFALDNTSPPKPGLVRDRDFVGPGIEVEVWAMPKTEFGGFVNDVPMPLGIGNLELADGKVIKGFICEQDGLYGATEITRFQGWRNYLKSIQ